MSQNFQIKKFNILKIGDNVALIIGKRGVGKTMLIKDILHYYPNIGAIIAPMEKTYNEIISDDKIHEEYNPEIIQNVMKDQRENEVKESQVIVMDDSIHSIAWRKDLTFRALISNSKFYKIPFIFSMQYPMNIPPNMRTNLGFIFIFKESFEPNKRKLYQYFAGMFPTYINFCTVLDQCIDEYGCLVIDTTVINSDRIEDQIYWYKAEIHNDKNNNDKNKEKNNDEKDDEKEEENGDKKEESNGIINYFYSWIY